MRIAAVVAILPLLTSVSHAETGIYQSYVSGVPGDLLWVVNTQTGQVKACDSLGLDCLSGPETTVNSDVGTFQLLGSGKPGTVWIVNTQNGAVSTCSLTGPISCYETKQR